MPLLNGPEYIPDGPIENVVILLHGLGSNGDDLLSLVPMVTAKLPHTAFLSPNAPLPVPMSYRGFQWFEFWDRSMAQIDAGIRAVSPDLDNFIHAAAKRFKISTTNIALVGFSQGTMMALHVGLRFGVPLAGIIGFSGAMISPETLPSQAAKPMPPVLLIHGMLDPVVPVFASQQAEQVIRAAGGNVRLMQRPFLPHSIDDGGITEAAAFLKKIFTEKEI